MKSVWLQSLPSLPLYQITVKTTFLFFFFCPAEIHSILCVYSRNQTKVFFFFFKTSTQIVQEDETMQTVHLQCNHMKDFRAKQSPLTEVRRGICPGARCHPRRRDLFPSSPSRTLAGQSPRRDEGGMDFSSCKASKCKMHHVFCKNH